MWEIKYLPEAQEDLDKLDKSMRTQVLKGILKVAQNPISIYKGGYGKPLGGKLAGLFKIKFKSIGIRVVYELYDNNGVMNIIIV